MSSLDFKVISKPIFTTDPRTGREVPVTFKKALMREDNGEILEVVGASYRIIQNEEVFEAIKNHIAGTVGESVFDNVVIKDSSSRGGKTCYRQYVFPDIKFQVESGSKSDISFRIIAINGFGSSAVKIYAGAIDSFCTNGMIIGEYSLASVRHSSNAQVNRALNPIDKALSSFKEQEQIWLGWQNTKVVINDAVLLFRKCFKSGKLLSNLTQQLKDEFAARGNTKWAVYSALTYYATHKDSKFPIATRSTGNEPTVLFRRECVVNALVKSEDWQQLGN